MKKHITIALGSVIIGVVFVLVLAGFALREPVVVPVGGTSFTSPARERAYEDDQKSKNALLFGTSSITVDIADTPALQVRGLSGRTLLESGTGLFFIFSSDAQHGIWMKEMLFSIDVVWLDANLVVVDIEERVSPDTFPQKFKPEVPSRYILEIPAGNADRFGITIGSQAIFLTE